MGGDGSRRADADILCSPAPGVLAVELRSRLRGARRDGSRSGRRWRNGLGAAFGCSPHVDHQCFERPEPQVIGAPPDHLVKETGIDPRPDHGRSSQRLLGLAVLGLRMCPVFGKVALADAFGLERLLTGRTAFLDGVGGQLEQDLTGKVLFFGCSGASSAANHLSNHLTCPETAAWSPPPPKAAASATTSPIRGSATRYTCWPPSICPAPATPRRSRS
jgi:hypothetical protein